MQSSKATIDEAIADFQFLRSHSPYRFGGKWFIAQTADGFVTYRTKRAAFNNTITQVWFLDFGV